MIYWDTSAAIKLYVPESDSVRWEAFATASDRALISSVLLDLEMATSLIQKELRKELRTGAARSQLTRFRNDTRRGRFNLFPIGADIIEEGVTLAERLYHAQHFLRTLDTIHLATAIHHGCKTIATCDDRMSKAAAKLGLKLVDPSA